MAHIGPVLPPGWKPQKSDDEKSDTDDDVPGSSEEKDEQPSPAEEADCYGPALPPDLIQESSGGGEKVEQSDDDDDDGIGPVPESTNESEEAYSYRLYKLRREKEEEEDIKQRKRAREEWMTELPSKLSKSYGLTARTFKKHDTSSGADAAWTETPEERQRNREKPSTDKSKDDKAVFRKAAAERDRKFDAEVERLNEKREKESLMEQHAKKRKKDQEEAEKSGKSERRPFDREKDLKIVNLKSAADRKSTIDKVNQLGTRFGHGGDQKYL